MPNNSRIGRNRKGWDTKKPKSIAAYTARYLKGLNPNLYNKAVELLASPDLSFKDIEQSLHIHWRSLRAIYEAEAQSIEQQRTILARKTSRTLRSLVERVEDTAGEMKPRDAIFGISVLFDKLALLTGSPTSHNVNFNVNTQPVDIAAQFEKLHAAIEEKAAKVTQEDTSPKSSDPTI